MRTLLTNGSVYSPADPHATALCIDWLGPDGTRDATSGSSRLRTTVV